MRAMATDTSESTPAALVHLERFDDGVALVTLDHPKVNALSAALLSELHGVATELAADPPGAVVVTGGDRIFAAGAEISEFGGPDEAAVIGDRIHATLDAIAAIPRMVIASVSGYALGGGCELALACDVRFASTRARFGQPEILLGIIPGGGGTQRLARLIGPAKAKDLILTGRHVPADEALAIGLVDYVVPADELTTTVMAYAAELARGPLQAHALAKSAIDRGLDSTLADGLELERQAFVEVFRTADSQAGVASFLVDGPGHATFTGA